MPDTRRALRYEIPVDDRFHPIPAGRVLMAQPWRQAQRSPAGVVELWVEVDDPGLPILVRVFGTGQPIPDRAAWLASCLDGPLVWHVYDVTTVTEATDATA